MSIQHADLLPRDISLTIKRPGCVPADIYDMARAQLQSRSSPDSGQ